jgi:hypothetical protein
MTHEYTQPNLLELADYRAMSAETPMSLTEYAALCMTPDVAIASTKLFYPDFVLHEEAVFLAYRFDETLFARWKAQLGDDLAAVERVINHVHVAADLMVSPFEDMSYGNIAYFGAILMKTWKAALMAEFPSRRFEMRGEKDGDFDDFVITFWQLDR